ncbi:BQ5605_C042g12006 [Microbotryum silenes-dioicae]|uniref:BQ5605_C042g12006 protein n=1 Tax=Microbotryum silenes-dioicae TaxID=796604 RepID=A0A2X0MQD1_9BASI|nr:BQ5605_C042g12006 [Microbotryum silenes-dioicae]
MQRAEVGVGRAHDGSVDVTARSDGVEQHLVDLLHRGLKVGFDDAVELECLARRKLERVVTSAVGDLVNGKPLRRGAHASGQAHADHERVGGLEAGGLAFVADISVVLLVDAVELGQLTIGFGERTRRRVLETFLDRASEVVGRNLDVLVCDGLELGFVRLEAINAKRLPHGRLPDLVSGLRSIRVLVVSETEGHDLLRVQLEQGFVQILARLVVVVRILFSRPVVRVTETEDGELHLGEVGDLTRLEGLPQLTAVLREFTLSGDRGEEGNVFLKRDILDRHVVEGKGASSDTALSGATDELPRKLLGVTTIGREENEQRRTLERVGKGVKGLSCLPFLQSDQLGASAALERLTEGR